MVNNSLLNFSINAKKTRATLLKASLNNTTWPDGSVLKFVVMGLSGAGKSTCMDFIENGSINQGNLRVPTISFTPYRFDFGRIKLIFIDAPGQEVYWDSWKRYLKDINGIIFVIDATDVVSLTKVNFLLNNYINLEKNSCPIAFFVNKQDKPKSLTAFSITALLNFNEIKKKSRQIKAFNTSAKQGKGFHQAMSWLMSAAHNNFQEKYGN